MAIDLTREASGLALSDELLPCRHHHLTVLSILIASILHQPLTSTRNESAGALDRWASNVSRCRAFACDSAVCAILAMHGCTVHTVRSMLACVDWPRSRLQRCRGGGSSAEAIEAS